MSSSDRLRGRKTLRVTGVLEELEKDDVKRGVDIVELFGSFGVPLIVKGKSHAGRCPWHEDSTPSLSVDREKGLYHCFGCGESGDVVSLVQKMKACDFSAALSYLKSWKGSPPASSGKRKPRSPAARPNARPDAEERRPEHPEVNLDLVVSHYHKRLAESRAAREYLESRGLGDAQLAGRFSVGFADGSLLELLSNGQAKALKQLEILSSGGREHFGGCVTFPLFDEGGQAVGIYGRAVDESRRVRHLYLPGPHRGLFNRKAAAVFDELLLTESIIDALSLIALGVENVVALFGAGGFTEEHLALLKEGRVKTVVLALDGDEAGRAAAEKLKGRLLEDGFAVKLVFPPSGKDWNEYLLAGGSGEAVKTLIGEAEVHRRPPEVGSPAELVAHRDGPRWLFTRGGLSYRLLGVRQAFLSNLRVNVRVEYGGSTYLDNVDLYSARSRGAFALALSHMFDLEAPRVERDLLAIVDHLEAERDREMAEAAALSVAPELTEEQRRTGMELLTSPDLLERITGDLEELGYVGEELNKQLLYIAASSRKMEDPISVLILSESASGKSLLVESVRALMPEEEVVALSSLSDQALNYLPEGGLLHKFLILGEAVHSEVVEHQIREMLSAHELSRLVTVKDPKSGELTARMVRSPVVVAAVMSSTSRDVNPENASRTFLVNTDESREQTRRIHSRQRQKYTLERHVVRRSRVPAIVAAHKAAQRLLESRLIVNPFADALRFPDALMRSRRDHERFLDLIAAVAHLRQFQKEEKESRDSLTGELLRYIECDLEDYRIAYRIMEATLPATLSNFPPAAEELYEALRDLLRRRAEAEGLKVSEVAVTQREIREACGYSQRWIKRYMQVLAEWEYLQVGGLRRRGSRHSYRLVADAPIHLVDLSMIPSPEEIAEATDG